MKQKMALPADGRSPHAGRSRFDSPRQKGEAKWFLLHVLTVVGVHLLATLALIAGENEFESNSCQVKDLRTGDSTEVSLAGQAAELVKQIQQRLAEGQSPAP